MKITQLTTLLNQHPEAELRFVLPDGGIIAPSAHITEVGRVEKLFIDCGGKPRRTASCNLQVWEYTDDDHRLLPGKLSAIMAKAAPIFGGDDLPVEIEYQDGLISQYPVTGGAFENGVLSFSLELKHTACLALELCAPAEDKEECCGGTSCCG